MIDLLRRRRGAAYGPGKGETMVGKYPVITLCGSTRFKSSFYEAQKRLTLRGNIVISVGLFGHAGDEEVWEGMDEDTVTETKTMLDDMHKRKIDMADGIYVINVGGYIGSSTRSEIAYAAAHGKTIDYLEQPAAQRCPVCGRYYFTEPHSYEICPICGWEDDPSQKRYPDMEGGANHESLNEARRKYEAEHGTEKEI